MRLVDTTTWEVKVFDDHKSVSYAILSHRWEEDEVSLQDLLCPGVEKKKGYVKIRLSCAEALRSGLPYIWIDTCCIDKTSSAELSEAINSMYMWYEAANVCYAYLSDVESINDLENSLWFTRGWTLQELIAPKRLKFFNKHWQCFGSKDMLRRRLSKQTGIAVRILCGDDKPNRYSIAQRMSWAAKRTTTRTEDIAYCLMGLFNVNMPLLYGESSKAFIRLQEEIIKISDDQSIFAWSSNQPGRRGIFAPSPACFAHSVDVISTADQSEAEEYSITNVGLSIRLSMFPWTADVYMAILQCEDRGPVHERYLMSNSRHAIKRDRLGILVRSTNRDRQYVRIALDQRDIFDINPLAYQSYIRPVRVLLLRHSDQHEDPDHMYGYVFRSSGSWFQALFGHYSKSQSQNNVDDDDWLDLGIKPFNAKQLITHTNWQRVKTVSLPCGTYGSVINFSFQDVPSHVPAAELPVKILPYIQAMDFAFDFEFNPVCIIYRKVNLKAALQYNNAPTTLPSPDDIETQISTYQDMPTAFSWWNYGLMVLRGHRLHGLRQTIEELDLEIEIKKEWRGIEGTAWVIVMNQISRSSKPMLSNGYES